MDTPLQIALLSFIMFIASLFFAISGFGAGTTFQIGYFTLVSLGLIEDGRLAQVVIYLTLSQMILSMVQAIFLRKYIIFQPKYATIFLLCIFGTTIIGNEVLVRNDNILLVRILGGLLFTAFILNVIKIIIERTHKEKFDETHSLLSDTVSSVITTPTTNELTNDINGMPSDVVKYELDKWYKYIALIIACLASGFLRGLFAVGGPPLIVYTLATNVDRRIIRAINTAAIGFASGIPLIVNLFVINNEFDTSEYITYIACFFSFLFGLLIGNIVYKYVDHGIFQSMLIILLFSGAINLLLVDLGEISRISSIIVATILLSLMSFIFIRIATNFRKEMREKRISNSDMYSQYEMKKIIDAKM